MSGTHEFHYRIGGRVGGWRPGSHAGSRLGAGQEFSTHLSLFDWPDPRRLDLRASLRATHADWLVRVNRQRAGVAVTAVVDVSASMDFGAGRSKLAVAADFVEALGQSAFRAGDAVGMLAFDALERTELFVPGRLGRGMGSLMAEPLRQWRAQGAGCDGLTAVLRHLAGRQGLVFLVSDFHWPLQALDYSLHRGERSVASAFHYLRPNSRPGLNRRDACRVATGCTQPVRSTRVEYNPWHPNSGPTAVHFEYGRTQVTTFTNQV